MLYKYRYVILLVLFLFTLSAFWPGIYMHDSSIQYAQALSGQYSDHHPPLMAFVWRYLNFIHPGSGLLFLLQVILIYCGIFILMRIADGQKFFSRNLAYALLLLYPIYPQILIYEIVILKDVLCAAGFLLSGASLAYYTLKNKRPSIKMSVILLVLFIFSAAVKYQAQFLIIVYAIWLGCLLGLHKKILHKVAIGMLLYLIISSSVFLINTKLTHTAKQSFAWQYVKLYDLAAMSVQTRQDLIPNFNKTSLFSMQRLQQQFTYPAVDSLVFKQDPLLEITRDPQQMQILRAKWWREVFNYPTIYLRHRMYNMRFMLLARAGYEREVQDIPLSFTNDYKDVRWINLTVNNTLGIAFYIFMSHLPVIVLGIMYLVFGLLNWSKQASARVLVAFTATGLSWVGLLFFMSMAGTPRYTYLAIIMIHAAHIFAYVTVTRSRNLAH